MIDWTSTMSQTFEFYVVDPGTWKDRALLEHITSCTINRDSSSDTLGSASMNSTEVLDECYIRVYLKVIQNGVTEKVPLGTFLVQTPSIDYDGKMTSVTLDGYTPLIELKGSPPPVGYSLLKGTNIMSTAFSLCRENLRAPVVKTSSDVVLETDFVASLDEKWNAFIADLIAKAKYKLGLDEMSRVIFEPVQDMRSLRPVWTYTDDNSSILYPNFKDERDLYDVPNVVEVVYSTGVGFLSSRIVNDDPNSPVSTVNRGWTKVHRDTNPSIPGNLGDTGQRDLDEYAKQLLRNLSSLEHTITYKHGYCPVRVGDCVLLNHESLGLVNVKAKVISQSITCETGCPVEETAVYTTKLWG